MRSDSVSGLPSLPRETAAPIDDLSGFLEGVRSRGGSVVAGPRPRGDGVLQAYLTDPDGNVVELMQTGVPVTGDEPEIGVPQP